MKNSENSHWQDLQKKPEFKKVERSLERFDPEELDKIERLICRFRLNINQAFEASQIFFEMKLKEKAIDWPKWLHLEIAAGQKPATVFLEALRAYRMPTITHLRGELQKRFQAAKIPNARWIYSDNFESTELKLELSLTKPEDLETLGQVLHEKREVIQALLQFIRDPK